jgi:DNA invertase Pin-like site-specific DNA recombinase
MAERKGKINSEFRELAKQNSCLMLNELHHLGNSVEFRCLVCGRSSSNRTGILKSNPWCKDCNKLWKNDYTREFFAKFDPKPEIARIGDVSYFSIEPKNDEKCQEFLGYCRVSTVKQQAINGWSMVTQDRLIRRFVAKENGYLVKCYYDFGISGAEIENRPAMKKIIEDAKEGQTIISAYYDRFGKNFEEMTLLKKNLSERGVQFLPISELPSEKMGIFREGSLPDFTDLEDRTIYIEECIDCLGLDLQKDEIVDGVKYPFIVDNGSEKIVISFDIGNFKSSFEKGWRYIQVDPEMLSELQLLKIHLKIAFGGTEPYLHLQKQWKFSKKFHSEAFSDDAMKNARIVFDDGAGFYILDDKAFMSIEHSMRSRKNSKIYRGYCSINKSETSLTIDKQELKIRDYIELNDGFLETIYFDIDEDPVQYRTALSKMLDDFEDSETLVVASISHLCNQPEELAFVCQILKSKKVYIIDLHAKMSNHTTNEETALKLSITLKPLVY